MPEAAVDPYAPLARVLRLAEPVQNLLLARPRRALVERLRASGCRRVLDVCCGGGALARRLAAAGMAVVGVDASATMLARARAGAGGPEYHLRDAAELPWDGEFDGAVIALALHEMDPPQRLRVWEAMRRAVRPDRGLLVALDYARPERSTPLSRLAAWLVEADERGFAEIQPAHYRNYREFLAGRGLPDWVRARGDRLVDERRFDAGTTAVVTVSRG